MRMILLRLLGLCALAGCQAVDTATNDGLPCKLGFLGSLALTPSAGHVALAGTINGKPARLWLDTGSFSSILVPDAVRGFGLTPYGVSAMGGIGGTRPLAVYRARQFSVGNIQGTDFAMGIGVLPVPAGIDGLLGMDFFSKADLDVDMPAQRLNLYMPVHDCSHPRHLLHEPIYTVPLMVARPGHAYAAETGKSQPRIRVTVAGVSLVALLDTGAPQNVVFRNGARKLGVAIDHLTADPRIMIAGLGPRISQVPHHTLPPIQVGDLRLQNWRASVVSDTVDDVDLLLGLDFFRRVHVWISHSSAQLIMQFPPSPSLVAEGAPAAPPLDPRVVAQ